MEGCMKDTSQKCNTLKEKYKADISASKIWASEKEK